MLLERYRRFKIKAWSLNQTAEIENYFGLWVETIFAKKIKWKRNKRAQRKIRDWNSKSEGKALKLNEWVKREPWVWDSKTLFEA